jgi:DNA mismatch repair protein MutS2
MSVQRFKEGDGVRIISLKKDGVIQTPLSAKKYRVAIGPLTITCVEDDLVPREAPRSPPPQTPRLSRSPSSARPAQSLDLHGLTVEEALRALDAWLDAVILSDLSHVKVVHGLGTGRVKRAVHERLQTFTAVKRFAINQWNTGETDVYL